MKLLGTAIQKTFLVEHQGKTYCVDYVNSDYQSLSLLNRDSWEIKDEDGEEVSPYFLRPRTRKQKAEQALMRKTYQKLVTFCSKNFEGYKSKRAI